MTNEEKLDRLNAAAVKLREVRENPNSTQAERQAAFEAYEDAELDLLGE
jgi:hypothetical protein